MQQSSLVVEDPVGWPFGLMNESVGSIVTSSIGTPRKYAATCDTFVSIPCPTSQPCVRSCKHSFSTALTAKEMLIDPSTAVILMAVPKKPLWYEIGYLDGIMLKLYAHKTCDKL
jgi:hypothetical protein